MEAVGSKEASVHIYQITRDIPEQRSLGSYIMTT
jgi:hypothetical protein